MIKKSYLVGGIQIIEFTGDPPTHTELMELEMEEKELEDKNLMYSLDNGEIIDLFRSSNEVNFTKFLDNYEYIEEALVKKGK